MLESRRISFEGVNVVDTTATVNGASAAAQVSVKAWLLSEGYRVESTTSPDTHWLLVATDESGRPLAVGQKVDRPERLMITATSQVADEHQRKFEALAKKRRDDFLWDVRFALLQTNVEFDGLNEPVGLINVGELVYLDALTKDCFMQRVSQVRKAQLLVLWKFQQLFEENPEKLGFMGS
jgi:hypothetical protein